MGRTFSLETVIESWSKPSKRRESKMENLEMLSASAELKDLFAALAKAQAEMKPAIMDMKNPHYNSRYASLTSCQDAYREPLSKNGLTIVQQIFSIEEKFFIRSILGHISGQWISNTFRLLTEKSNMQGLGSAITYARRYGANSLVGVVDTEDDDANGSVGLPPKNLATPKPLAQTNKITLDKTLTAGGLTEPQLKRLFAIANEKEWTHDQVKFYMSARWELESTKDLNPQQYEMLINTIQVMSYVQAIKQFHDKTRPQD